MNRGESETTPSREIVRAHKKCSREPLKRADRRSMRTEPTDNSFDPAIWAIAAALSLALLYLVLLE